MTGLPSAMQVKTNSLSLVAACQTRVDCDKQMASLKEYFLSRFNYRTKKYIVATNWKIGVVYRLYQFAVLGYVIGWVFIIKKGYQETENFIQTSVFTKLKGVALTKCPERGFHLWDEADYTIPPHGEQVFFVMTNYIETHFQRMGLCPENYSVLDGRCESDKDCAEGEAVKAGHGIKTGVCINSTGTCQIIAWCPLEQGEKPETPLLSGAENFTVLIKNFVRFPKFDYSKSNMLETAQADYLKNCTYDPEKHPYCPIFRLGHVVKEAGSDFQEMASSGGSVGIFIEWKCDLDKDDSKCNPRYSFARLSVNVGRSGKASGYNHRHAKYFMDPNGTTYRTLYKAYGIRFDVIVNGVAGKFSVIPTVIALGSGFAFLGIGSFVCDMILLHLTDISSYYRQRKFEIVNQTESSHTEDNNHPKPRSRKCSEESKDSKYPNETPMTFSALLASQDGEVTPSPDL